MQLFRYIFSRVYFKKKIVGPLSPPSVVVGVPDVSQVKPLYKGINPYKSPQALGEPKSSSSPASSISSAEQILKQIKYHREQQERDLHDFAQSLVDEGPSDGRTKYLQHTAQQQQLHQQQQLQQNSTTTTTQAQQSKNDKNAAGSRNSRRLGRHESRYTSGN